jgi:hypothetical protein
LEYLRLATATAFAVVYSLIACTFGLLCYAARVGVRARRLLRYKMEASGGGMAARVFPLVKRSANLGVLHSVQALGERVCMWPLLKITKLLLGMIHVNDPKIDGVDHSHE